MAEFRKPRGRPDQERRPRTEPREDAPRGRPRAGTAEEMLELADELEEQGRALLSHARQLQRMASSLEGGARERAPEGGGSRPPQRGGGGGSRPPQRRAGADRKEDAPGEKRRPPAREGGGSARRRPDAPAWTPERKRGRPER